MHHGVELPPEHLLVEERAEEARERLGLLLPLRDDGEAVVDDGEEDVHHNENDRQNVGEEEPSAEIGARLLHSVNIELAQEYEDELDDTCDNGGVFIDGRPEEL